MQHAEGRTGASCARSQIARGSRAPLPTRRLRAQAVQTAEALAEAYSENQQGARVWALAYSQKGGMLAQMQGSLIVVARPGSRPRVWRMQLTYSEWSPDSDHVLAVRAGCRPLQPGAPVWCNALVGAGCRACCLLRRWWRRATSLSPQPGCSCWLRPLETACGRLVSAGCAAMPGSATCATHRAPSLRPPPAAGTSRCWTLTRSCASWTLPRVRACPALPGPALPCPAHAPRHHAGNHSSAWCSGRSAPRLTHTLCEHRGSAAAARVRVGPAAGGQHVVEPHGRPAVPPV